MNSSRSRTFSSLLLLLLLLRLTADALTFTPEEQQWIEEHPVVTLGADHSWPPYDFVDNHSRHTGIAADFLQLISQKSGLRFDVTPGVWSKVIAKMRKKGLDGLTCAVKTPEREKYLTFTTPYVSMPLAIIVQEGRDDIRNIDGLAGRVVAVNRGSYLHEWLVKHHPEIRLHLTSSNDESVEAVSFGDADAYIGNIAVANYIIKTRYLSNLKIIDRVPDVQTEVSVAIDKDSPLLHAIIEKTLASISQDERNKITRRWFDLSKADSDTLQAKDSDSSGRIELTAEEQTWIKRHPVLTYSEVDWRPMSIIKKGTMVGILDEYLRLIAQQTGIGFKYVPSTSWVDVLERFKEGKIDLVPGIGANAYESSLGLTSKTFASYPFVLVTRDDESFINSIDEIEEGSKTIAVPKYWSSYNYLVTEKPNIKIIEAAGVLEALDLVRKGKAYAFLGHMTIAMHYVGNYHPNDLHIAGKIDYLFEHQILLHEQDKVLLGIIDKAIANISEADRVAIRQKWIHVKVKEVQDLSFLWKYLVVILFLFILFIYWNRKLSSEITERRRIEDALHVEKENFKVLFEKVSDGNLIVQEGKFITANEAALKMLGLKDLSELLETRPSQWSPSYQEDGSASDKKADELIQRCLDEGDQRFEWIHKDSSGREFWVDVGLTKISYRGDDAVYVVWRDIDGQKNLEVSLKQSEAQIRMILDHIPLLVIVTSYDGKILMANPQALNEYGFTPEVLREANILEYYADQKERDIILQTLQVYGKVEQRIVKFKIRDAMHSMMLSILPIDYDHQGALLSIAVDMTERLKMEEALVDAKDSADMANRSKSEFLANMSHEIRTPMNAIIGFTELLDEQVEEPRLRSYVRTIQNAGKTLLTLINDILDLSKIEAGRLEIDKRPTDLFALSEDVGAIFMMSVKDKGLELIIDIDDRIPQSLLVDAVRIRQILLNLIGNAVKFTEHGQIKLTMRLLRLDGHLSKVDLEIAVIDSGIGIPEDQLEHIFKDFAQRDGQDNRKFGGTGLGLSISKRLVEMMEGKISVESHEGVGTTFFVRLPGVEIASVRVDVDSDARATIDAHAIVFKPAKVLVVDDNEDNRDLIASIFEDSAIEVSIATDGLQAISAFERDRPDLILMDIRMPNMDGYAAASKIKRLSDVPIVALTASVMNDELDKRKREDFDDYLRKPVLRDELFHSLSRFLKYSKVLKRDDKDGDLSLSKKAKANLAVILKSLSDEVTPTYEQAVKSNNISELKKLASQVHQLAEQYDVSLLERYALGLDETIDAFDITRMQQLIHEYPGLVGRIRSL